MFMTRCLFRNKWERKHRVPDTYYINNDRAVGSSFMVVWGGGRGGLSKNVGHHNWQTTKKFKKMHWLKHPKAVHPKNEIWTKIQTIQNLIFGILYLKILFRAYIARLNNFFKVAPCLGLAKCFAIFHSNWNFWKFNCFLAFQYFYL